MKLPKGIAILLIAAMLLASCGKTDAENTSDGNAAETAAVETAAETAVETAAETVDPITARTLQDDVPDMDFNGAEFRVLTQDILEIWAGELTGEALNDAVYQRNQIVEERFNVKIAEPTNLSHGDIAARVRAAVRADDDEFDLVLGQMEESGKNALEGSFQNWHDIPYMDFEKPWYPKSMMMDGVASLNDTMYLALSDMCITYVGQTWAMIYDYAAAENYGITDVYKTVKSGKWTIDKLNEWTADIYTDTNGDGIRDEGDFYGLIWDAAGCSLAAQLYGFGLRTAEIKDGEIVFHVNSEKFVSAFEKIASMIQNEGTITSPFNGLSYFKLFPTECTVFSSMQLRFGYSHLRDCENDFGYIPLPKWDEEQEEYYTTTDAGCDIMAVLTTAANTEMIGAISEVLSAESWRTVMPVYCDISLGTKSARDAESLEMINLVLESRYIDFAYLYDAWNGWTFRLDRFLKNEDTFASTYQAQERIVTNHYEKVLDMFQREE